METVNNLATEVTESVIAKPTKVSKNIFDILQSKAPNKVCKIMSLKDESEAVPFGTLNVLSAKNGSIGDTDGNDLGKSIVVECLSWSYRYLVSNGEEILADSTDGVTSADGELLEDIVKNNPKSEIKTYINILAVHDDVPVVISLSPYGVRKFKRMLSTLVLKSNDSALLEITATNAKSTGKSFTYLDVKIV